MLRIITSYWVLLVALVVAVLVLLGITGVLWQWLPAYGNEAQKMVQILEDDSHNWQREDNASFKLKYNDVTIRCGAYKHFVSSLTLDGESVMHKFSTYDQLILGEAIAQRQRKLNEVVNRQAQEKVEKRQQELLDKTLKK
jgi:hypothetical protein